MSKVYELQSNPDWEDLVTVKSHLNGERVSIYNAPLRSPEDANRKTRAARALAEVIGCCTHRCTGSEAFAGLGPCTYDMDQDLGTHYFERFTKFLDYVQNPDYDAFDRLRATRFIEHMARGSNWTAMALHGGGNQEASTVMARSYTDWKHLQDMVKAAAGITKDPEKCDAIIASIGKRQGRICTTLDLPHAE